MTFTPGPWEANRWRVCAGCGEGERISVICDTAHNMKTRTAENEANARLIAAAPDFLEAAKLTEDFQELNLSNYDHDDVEKLHAWAVMMVLELDAATAKAVKTT